MKVKWNNCFFCLNELNDKGTVKCQNIGPPIKLLLTYLLGDFHFKGCGSLTQSILDSLGVKCEVQLAPAEERGDGEVKQGRPNKKSSLAQFCDNCRTAIESFSELHLQLEVIQMQMINIVQTLRKLVLNNSQSSGDGKMVYLKIFEDWLNEQQDSSGGRTFENERLLLDVIRNFQRAVSGTKVPVQVPVVLLEKGFNYSTAAQPSLSENVTDPNSITNNLTEVNEDCSVKTEPEDIYFEDNAADDHHNHDSFMDSTIEAFTTHLEDVKSSTKKSKARVTKRKLVKSSHKKLKTTNPPTAIRSKKLPKVIESKLSDGPRNKRIYSCITCPYKTKRIHKFEFHLRKHETGERIFKCPQCPQDNWFSEKQHFEFHVTCHKRKYRMYCDICNTQVEHVILTEHMKSCLEEACKSNPSSDIKLFPCPNCSFCSSVRDKYLEHLREHDKSGKVFCDICSEEMPTRYKLLEHLYNVHQAIEKQTCTQQGCNKSFLDTKQFWIHEQGHLRPSQCAHCPKSFKNNYYLKVHERTHTGERPYPCPDCEESFKVKADLVRHQINTHNGTRFQCQFCEKSYTDPGSLLQHVRIHTGETFPCDQCGVQFESSYRLRRHMHVHSDRLNFVCDLCGKAFRTKDSLGSHRKTHSTEKVFKCEHCSKAFKRNQHLIAHIRTHTGERPFVCDTCGATFTQAGPLNQHKKRHF